MSDKTELQNKWTLDGDRKQIKTFIWKIIERVYKYKSLTHTTLVINKHFGMDYKLEPNH